MLHASAFECRCRQCCATVRRLNGFDWSRPPGVSHSSCEFPLSPRFRSSTPLLPLEHSRWLELRSGMNEARGNVYPSDSSRSRLYFGCVYSRGTQGVLQGTPGVPFRFLAQQVVLWLRVHLLRVVARHLPLELLLGRNESRLCSRRAVESCGGRNARHSSACRSGHSRRTVRREYSCSTPAGPHSTGVHSACRSGHSPSVAQRRAIESLVALRCAAAATA